MLAHEGDVDSIPGAGRFPGEGNGNPPPLAWGTPRTEEAGGLPSWGRSQA